MKTRQLLVVVLVFFLNSSRAMQPLEELAHSLKLLANQGILSLSGRTPDEIISALGPNVLVEVAPSIYHMRSLAQTGVECGWHALYNTFYLLALVGADKNFVKMLYERMLDPQNYELFATNFAQVLNVSRGDRCVSYYKEEIEKIALSAGLPSGAPQLVPFLLPRVGKIVSDDVMAKTVSAVALKIKTAEELLCQIEKISEEGAKQLRKTITYWDNHLVHRSKDESSRLFLQKLLDEPKHAFGFVVETSDFSEHAFSLVALRNKEGKVCFIYTDSLSIDPQSEPTVLQRESIEMVRFLMEDPVGCLVRILAVRYPLFYGKKFLPDTAPLIFEGIKREQSGFFVLYKERLCTNIQNTLMQTTPFAEKEKKVLQEFLKKVEC